MVKFDIMNIRKVFPIKGFRYKSMCIMWMSHWLNFVFLKNLYAFLYFIGLKLTTWSGTWKLEKLGNGWKGELLGLGCGWNTPWPTKLKNLAWNSWFNSWGSTSKWMENMGLLLPLFQKIFFPLPLPWLPVLKKLIV